MTRRLRDLSEILSADEIIAIERKRLRRLVEAERREEPWPSFGAYGDARAAARDGFNMAIDVVLDLLTGRKEHE